MIKKITFLVGFLCAILFVNSLYAMYNSNGKRDYSEEQNQENKKRTKYDDVDQSNLNTPIIEQGNDIFVFDKDVTQSLQVNTFAKSLIFKVYPSEDQLTKIGLKFPNVQKIDISDILRNVSSDRKKKFLRELLNFQALKELICNNNMLTDIELSILPAFTHAPNNDNWLESIHLNQNLITDKGAKNIALMGRKLTKLSITHNQIEESGALSIVKMPQLKKLSLDKNLISDESWHNIQKIATEKNLIFIENKEDFFKQTFTDNFVLNNEPKIQQTLIQNFTPVLPLNVHNGPYSIPLENPYYVNNNNNQVVQNQNIKNDTYVFDREAKKTIGSFPKGGTIHINTIIFKIIPSSKQLDCIKSYYKDVNKIDMSILFGKNFLNIRRIKNDTWRSLLIDLKEFLMLKYEDADFNQFIENSYDQEPQNPFDFEKSRLYAERELFRKKDIRNVFINALFEESENSNNQIVTSQKQNNYTPLVNLQQNNSNNVKNKEQKENAKNNVYIFDCETKKTIESFPKGATIHINTIIFKIIPSFKQLYYIKSHYKNINKIDMSVLFGKKFSNIHRIKNDRPRSLLADLEEFLMLKYEDANFNQFIENSHCSEPQKPFDFEKSRLYAERELFRKKDIRNVFVNALFAEAENSSNQIVASQNLNNFSPQVNEQRHNSNIAQNVTQRQPQNITPNQQMPMPNNYAPSVNPQQYNLNNGQNMQRMLPQNVTPNPQISMPNNCAPPVNLQQNNSNNVENKEKKENTKNNIYIFDLKAKRKLQKDNLSLENTINTIILKIVPTRSDIKRLHKKYEFTKKIDASTLFGEKYSNINEDPNIKASLFNQLINFLEYKAINRHANNNEKFIFFVKEAKFTEPKIPFDIEKSSLNEKKEYIKRSCNPNVFINALFKESENSSIEQNKKNNVYVFDLEEKRKINFEDRLQTEHIDTIIFKIIPSTKYINFLSKNYKNIKKIDTSSLFGKKFLNIEMDSSIKASLITQLEIFTNCISDKQNNSGFSSFVDQAKKIEPRKPFDIEKSYLNEKKEYIKGCYNPNVFINALFAESEYSNNQIVTSQNLNNFSPQVNEQQHNSNIKRNVEFQKVTPNPQTPTPNNSMYQLNGQQHNSNIVPQGQPQKVTPNKQIPNNYAWQVNVQRTNSNNFENKDQKENSKNNVYVFDLEEKRKVKTERQLQQINMDEIIFKIIPPPKIINFLRKNKSYIKKIDASPIFGKKYSNIIPNLYIKKSLFSQFDDFIKNITAFNDNEIDISGFVKEAKENEPKKPLDIEKSRIYKERELFKEKNYPNVFINALFAESENSNNQIAASQNPNNFRPPVNAQQHNSNIGQNVQQRQPHNVMFNPQTPMPNNYAPQVNTQQHNLNIGQNVQRMQPQNVMPNPQMPTPNNYAPQVNVQQYNSNIGQNVQRMQPQNLTSNLQMSTPNNSMSQLNAQQHNSNIGQNVHRMQPQNMMPNQQMSMPNNYAPQVNKQQNNSSVVENKEQPENAKNNVYIFDLEEKRKIKIEDQLQKERIDTIIFKIIPTFKVINFLRKNHNNIKRIDASHLFGKKYSNINPGSGIKKSLFTQFDVFLKNIIFFNDNKIDISGFVKEAKENEPKKPLDIEKSRIYKERELFKEKNYPNVFINALFAESENSNNQIVTSQNLNNFSPQVNGQQHNSNIGQNIQRMQSQNVTPNQQMSMHNNYAPQLNAQQHNSNIGQNVQRIQPQNMMSNQQMPMPNNYAPQLNAQQHNSNIGQNIQRIQPQNMMSNQQMPMPNNYAPQVNAHQYNSNIGQNVQRMQPHNVMFNPQTPMPNNYAPQVNKQQHNLNIGQNVQRMQPQNVMPNPQMPTPNNYAPQVNTQQYNSNNVQRMQPHNMMLNPQMPIQNLASNTLIITEEKNNNDSDYKELLDLFYSEDIQNPVCNALEDAMFSFGNNERAFLQQGKPILLERKINFLHFEICPTENEIFQLFQNFNFIEKINISFALPKDKIDRIKILTALKIFQNLKELTAEGNELTDEDIICIAQGLPCLTLLNVDNNLIGDNGAVYVSCMQNLKELYVKSNKIKDKGAREIATMDNLEVFYYDNNEITPLGHKDIEELRKDVLFMHSLI